MFNILTAPYCRWMGRAADLTGHTTLCLSAYAAKASGAELELKLMGHSPNWYTHTRTHTCAHFDAVFWLSARVLLHYLAELSSVLISERGRGFGAEGEAAISQILFILRTEG